MEGIRIVIVDDEPEIGLFMKIKLMSEAPHFNIVTKGGGHECLAYLRENEADCILSDYQMPGMDGMELLEKIKSEQIDTSVIVMTGYASVDTAVRALKQGAFDYITKPFDPDDLSVVVRNALEQHKLKRENRMLREQLSEGGHPVTELIGQSEAMRKVREQIDTVAGVDSTVLIEGESGTGKELVARAVHRLSPRRYSPMVVVHCGALTETLIESELFGHEKGAFTGAQYRKKGKFEAAMGGTVFLDEIADISLKTQTDMLRVLQEREIVRVGGTQPIHVDFRVIAATNRNLTELVKEGRFRSDLYYRLNVFTIHLPALRDRHGDVPLLATHFLDKYSAQMNRKFTGLDRAAMDLLISHHWPGNVRELENIMERAVVVGHEPLVRAHDLGLARPAEGADDLSIESLERRHIVRVLEDFAWNQTQAAKALGIDRVTLYHKIRRYGLKPPAKAARA
ncbi:MAG TPA: sigma-54 dependent transcriptional regulator [Bryobacteraceae bacterium]